MVQCTIDILHFSYGTVMCQDNRVINWILNDFVKIVSTLMLSMLSISVYYLNFFFKPDILILFVVEIGRLFEEVSITLFKKV